MMFQPSNKNQVDRNEILALSEILKANANLTKNAGVNDPYANYMSKTAADKMKKADEAMAQFFTELSKTGSYTPQDFSNLRNAMLLYGIGAMAKTAVKKAFFNRKATLNDVETKIASGELGAEQIYQIKTAGSTPESREVASYYVALIKEGEELAKETLGENDVQGVVQAAAEEIDKDQNMQEAVASNPDALTEVITTVADGGLELAKEQIISAGAPPEDPTVQGAMAGASLAAESMKAIGEQIGAGLMEESQARVDAAGQGGAEEPPVSA